MDVTPETWLSLYEAVALRLGSRHEARWLVEEASGGSWPEILAGELGAAPRARQRLMDMVDRRLGGEPLQYVIGRWAFRSLDLMVDRRVLIPRPETEYVVELALGELDRMPGETKVAVDLGTGSGAIALSIAAERKRVEVWATDVSGPALDVARANLAGLAGFAATRVRIAEGHWWAALPAELRGRVDLLVSNPPYISAAEMGDLDQQVVGWEPALALEAGQSGLEALEEILTVAPQWLSVSGVAVVEMAPHQSGQARALAQGIGFSSVEVHPDLTGRDRVLVVRR